MSKSAELCVKSAEAHGGDRALIYPRSSLRRTSFYCDNQVLLDQERGVGYFAWKPFVISEEMEGLSDDSVIVYADAGIEFIDNMNHIIERMDQDVFLFGNMWEHAHWCKRDVVEAIWPFDICSLPITDIVRTEDEMLDHDLRLAWHPFGKQVQASVIFLRVNDYTRRFVKEWLDWCLFEGGRLIDDSPSRTPNHPEFRENRHDQAILTTMAYRDGIRLHAWPAVYNRDLPNGGFTYSRDGYPESDNYPSLFWHHRRRNYEWSVAA